MLSWKTKTARAGVSLSPFKDEKTPSFSVRRDPPVFFDYSSGIGGNVYTFVRHYNQCGPAQAIKILQDYAGLDGDVAVPHRKFQTTSLCKRFSPPPKHQKPQKKPVQAYQNDVMLRYEDRKDKLKIWLEEGMSLEALERFQVRYDPIDNRLVYPIFDLTGRVVNIGGRTLDPNYKEKKLRKYTYYSGWPDGMKLLYGLYENLDEIKKAKQVILFEGAKSVIKAYSYGFKNCGALLTSHLSPAQAEILMRLGVDVVFAVDNDVDIHKDPNIKKLKRYVRIFYLKDTSGTLGEKDSPVDCGPDVFQNLYEGRRRY